LTSIGLFVYFASLHITYGNIRDYFSIINVHQWSMDDYSDNQLLTTSAAAGLLDVHPSTVKRWCDEPALPSGKTVGGHRRIHLKDLLAFAEGRGIETILDVFDPWQANVWSALSAARGPQGFHRLIGLGLAWLARGETELLGRLILEAGRDESIPFSRFLDECIREFMREVGEEWRKGRLQVGEEHLATQVIEEVLVRLRIESRGDRTVLRTVPGAHPVALVGCVEGDQHELGAQAVRAVLERAGWRVYYLGPNVPLEEFAATQRAQSASLVCMSFSPHSGIPDLQRALTVLGEFYRPMNPYALALGGDSSEISAADLPKAPFEALSFFRSAGEFQDWLEAYGEFPDSGDPWRVA
jgi:excisionase family DNA binding protein